MAHDIIITDELLAAYAEGNVNAEERLAVRKYLSQNPKELESVMMMMDKDYDIVPDTELRTLSINDFEDNRNTLYEETEEICHKIQPVQTLPVTALAADNIVDNLCAIRCEGIAIRRTGRNISDEELQNISAKKGWLKEHGTALHNIGRLADECGMRVTQRYGCSINDIKSALETGNTVIVALDNNELTCSISEAIKYDTENGEYPNHAVLVETLDEESITITDSATPQQTDKYPLLQFMNAWADSAFYMVVVSSGTTA